MSSSSQNPPLPSLAGIFSGEEPADLPPRPLAVLSAGTMYFRGTAVQALGPQWKHGQNGLIIPAYLAVSPAPIDQMLVYLSTEEIYGVTPPADLIYDELIRIPAETVLVEAALVLAKLRHPGASRSDVDAEFARMWFPEPVRTRVLNTLRQPNRGLVVPQALLALIQYSMRFSGDVLIPGVRQGNLVLALMIVADQAGSELEVPSDEILTKVPGALGREVISNQIFNSGVDEVNYFARFYRIWLMLSKELAGAPEIEDLEAGYEELVGVPLRDVLSVGILLWSVTVNLRPVVDPAYLDGIPWAKQRLEKVLSVFCIDIQEFRAEVREEFSTSTTSWAFGAFSRFPVIRLWDGRLVVLDGPLLVRRIFGWLPIFDIKYYAASKGTASKKKAGRLEQSLRRLVEKYTAEVLDNLAKSTSGARRVYHDEQLKEAYEKHGVKIADAAIDCVDSWIVIEVTSSQLKRESVYGVSDQAIVDDLIKLVGEVEQIDSTIRSIRDNESRLTGVSSRPNKKFHPLLVTTEGFPVNPVSLTLIREHVNERGLLLDDDVEPLEVVDLVELEMVESLQENGGPQLVDLLAGKKNASLWRCSLRDYLLVEKKLRPGRSQRVEALWNTGSEELTARLFTQDDLDQTQM